MDDNIDSTTRLDVLVNVLKLALHRPQFQKILNKLKMDDIPEEILNEVKTGE